MSAQPIKHPRLKDGQMSVVVTAYRYDAPEAAPARETHADVFADDDIPGDLEPVAWTCEHCGCTNLRKARRCVAANCPTNMPAETLEETEEASEVAEPIKYSRLPETKDAWRDASKCFYGALSDLGLSTTEVKLFKHALYERLGITSTMHLTPAEFQAVADELLDMRLDARAQHVEAMIHSTGVGPERERAEACINAVCMPLTPGMHSIDTKTTKRLRRALMPHFDKAAMRTSDGVVFIVETQRVEVRVYLPYRHDEVASLRVYRSPQIDLQELYRNVQAILEK